MKRYNPRCRANWIYTTRYFPAFVSALPSRAVVISVISPHVRPFLSFSRLRPSLGRICILYHPPRHADEFCVAPLTRISTSLSAQSGTDKDHGTTPPPSFFQFFKIISFHYFSSAFYRPRGWSAPSHSLSQSPHLLSSVFKIRLFKSLRYWINIFSCFKHRTKKRGARRVRLLFFKILKNKGFKIVFKKFSFYKKNSEILCQLFTLDYEAYINDKI